MLISFFLFFAFILLVPELEAKTGNYDSLYIKTYPDILIGRTFLSSKYSSLSFNMLEIDKTLDYKPNTKLSMGLGATYKWATLNIGYGFPFLNDSEEKGETQSLDLQLHFYMRSWVVDFFFQSYQGMYLENTEEFMPNMDDYYLRPDISVFIAGLSGGYLFNGEKFSMRSAITQAERQTKGAGSLIVGLQSSLTGFNSDTSIAHNIKLDSLPDFVDSIRSVAHLKIGSSVGYGYNFIIFKRFFVFASLSLTVTFNNSRKLLLDESLTQETGLSIGTYFRFAAGYHTDKWYIGLSTLNSTANNFLYDNRFSTAYGSGRFFLTISRRIGLNKKFRESLKFVPGF